MVNNEKWGGRLSSRMAINTKPLFACKQDEEIFKQFQIIGKAWTWPSAEKALVPKDDGKGVMISAFLSRELGFGATLAGEDLEIVNEHV